MATPDIAAAYADTATNTLSGSSLLLELFARLERDVDAARTAITDTQIRDAHDALVHAQRIVAVLRTSLQPELFEGGYGLLSLYEALEAELGRANLEKSLGRLDICTAVIGPLHQAWKQAVARASDGEVAHGHHDVA